MSDIDDGTIRLPKDEIVPSEYHKLWLEGNWFPWKTRLEQAAIDYVAARLRNETSEPPDWSARLAEVDRAWHELVEASGLSPEQEKL